MATFKVIPVLAVNKFSSLSETLMNVIKGDMEYLKTTDTDGASSPQAFNINTLETKGGNVELTVTESATFSSNVTANRVSTPIIPPNFVNDRLVNSFMGW